MTQHYFSLIIKGVIMGNFHLTVIQTQTFIFVVLTNYGFLVYELFTYFSKLILNRMMVETVRDKTTSPALHAYTAICINKRQTRAFLCLSK
jgi:hypothetical protein